MTKTIGVSPNLFEWSIPKDFAIMFEGIIGKFLKRHVATKSARVKVIETNLVKDYGKDFIIELYEPAVIFSLPIKIPADKKSVIVFIEVKSTSHNRLSEGFTVDINQNFEAPPDYYFLVTNATLTPYYQFIAQHNWRLHGTEFVLIDRFLLLSNLIENNFFGEFEKAGIPFPNLELPIINDLVVEYQVEKRSFSNTKEVDIYLTIRNFNKKSRGALIRLATDKSWRIQTGQIDKVITTYGFESFRLTCERILFDGQADLRLTIEKEKLTDTLLVKEENLEFIFDPPFTGTLHKKCRDEITDTISRNESLRIISISGEAGIGKTRIIDEVWKNLRNGSHAFEKFHFTSGDNLNNLLQLFNRLDFKLPNNDQFIDESSCFDFFLRNFDPEFDQWVIIFEDLHHANKKIIHTLKDFIVSLPPKQSSIIFILTGRNDFTFPNEEYFSLLQTILSIENELIKHIEVVPLEELEAKNLIRTLIYNAPTIAVDKIFKLCQCNPFLILELIQYLLDQNIAQLSTKRYIGILDVERFASKNTIPESIEDLYLKRLDSLKLAKKGDESLNLLILCSFFGYEIRDEIVQIVIDGRDYDKVWKNLFERRFLKEHENNTRTFAHENLLHFIKKYSRLKKNQGWVSELILKNTGILLKLNDFEKGEVYYMSGLKEKAFKLFTPIWQRISQITNFSSEEIDKSFFPYLEYVFHCAKHLYQDYNLLSKIALAKGYMGIHNFPLYTGLKSCRVAEEMLHSIKLKNKNKIDDQLAIQQLRAHGLQNMGKTGEAIKLMLEIENEVRKKKSIRPDIEFDLYDRLQEFYRKINHGKLSDGYKSLAYNAVLKANDDKLLACHLITKAGVNLLKSKKLAVESANAAYQQAKAIGVFRFEIFTYVSILIANILHERKNSIELFNETYEEAKKLLIIASKNNLSDSIMRLQLLLSTLALQCFPNNSYRLNIARKYAEAGQVNSIRYGNGLFDWAFDNLIAIIDMENSSKPDTVRARFTTCHERLKRRGLLFLGAQDGIYPNFFALSNIARYFGTFSERWGLEYLSTVSAYNNEFLFKEKDLRLLLNQSLAGKAIFCGNRTPATILRYPNKKGYFTPIF